MICNMHILADDGKRWQELGVIQSGRYPKTGRYINAVSWRLFLSREDRMLGLDKET